MREPFQPAVTGEMWAEVTGSVFIGTTYALVAWSRQWSGRRVTCGTSLFDESGVCLAASEAMWIAI